MVKMKQHGWNFHSNLLFESSLQFWISLTDQSHQFVFDSFHGYPLITPQRTQSIYTKI